jgi:hypothetical protein
LEYYSAIKRKELLGGAAHTSNPSNWEREVEDQEFEAM